MRLCIYSKVIGIVICLICACGCTGYGGSSNYAPPPAVPASVAGKWVGHVVVDPGGPDQTQLSLQLNMRQAGSTISGTVSLGSGAWNGNFSGYVYQNDLTFVTGPYSASVDCVLEFQMTVSGTSMTGAYGGDYPNLAPDCAFGSAFYNGNVNLQQALSIVAQPSA